MPRYYDLNVRSERKRVEKLRYVHRNPVRRGLVVDWSALFERTSLSVNCLPLSSALHPDFANHDLAMYFLSRWHHREFGEVSY